jgi:hypothetical protein
MACSYLLSAASAARHAVKQAARQPVCSGAPHLLQALPRSPHPSGGLSQSSAVVTSPLHSYTHNCRPLNVRWTAALFYSASLCTALLCTALLLRWLPQRTGLRCLIAASRPGRLHRQPHQSHDCDAVTNTIALADLDRCTSTEEFYCKFATFVGLTSQQPSQGRSTASIQYPAS